MRQKSSDSAEPAVVQFNSADKPDPTRTLPSVRSDALVDAGTSPLVADLMKRLSDCYALPMSERVNSTATNATAANVIAAACTSPMPAVVHDAADWFPESVTLPPLNVFDAVNTFAKESTTMLPVASGTVTMRAAV